MQNLVCTVATILTYAPRSTHIHKYTDSTKHKFTHNLNKQQRLEAKEDASAEWKTWQVYCFGKKPIMSQVEGSMSGTDKTNGINYIYIYDH